MPIFKKRQPRSITYLECYSYSGCVYRVTGHYTGTSASYSIEVGQGAQSFVLSGVPTLAKANTLALYLLDNGAVPDDLRKADALRKQPCI